MLGVALETQAEMMRNRDLSIVLREDTVVVHDLAEEQAKLKTADEEFARAEARAAEVSARVRELATGIRGSIQDGDPGSEPRAGTPDGNPRARIHHKRIPHKMEEGSRGPIGVPIWGVRGPAGSREYLR